MIKGKTRSGFEFKVNEKLLDDWRLTKAIAAMNSGNTTRQITGAVDIAELLLGEQEEALYKSVMTEDGIVKNEDVMDNVSDIIAAMQTASEKAKN